MFVVQLYIAASLALTGYVLVWHYENGSPWWAWVHDVVMVWVWPVAIATRYRVRP